MNKLENMSVCKKEKITKVLNTNSSMLFIISNHWRIPILTPSKRVGAIP